MGIPNLLSTLEPYAEPGILDHRQVVIDGPALAYHILNKCIAAGVHDPTHELLGLSVIAWLDELVNHGVVM